MGGCCSSSDEESSNDFRKRKNVNADEFDGPVKGRGCTDIQYLVLFVLFLVVWAVLVGYAINRGDLRRIINGYDDCGNICGIKNEKLSDTNSPFYKCSGEDYTNRKHMLLHPKNNWSKNKRDCVSSCSERGNYKEYFHRCIPSDESLAYDILFNSTNVQEFFEKVAEDVSLCHKEIVYLCVFALALSIFLILLFRYFAGVLVWLVLICVVVVSVGISTYLWMLWKNERSSAAGQVANKTSTYFAYAIIATIVTIIILLLIFGMRKSIHLVSHIFYESGKAVQAMPMIVAQPFVTFIAIIFVLFIWAYFFVWIESSGVAQVKVNSEGRLTFKKDEVIQFARGFNFVAVFWMVQFLIGCQHMVISGAVATWFFTRKKNTLSTPILKSYSYLFFYHLGTVALGSLLIAIVQVIRAVFSMLKSAIKDPKNDVTRSLYKGFSCCLYCLEKILVFLTRNAYIEVAIFGDNLWVSGKRAFHVLTNNALRVTAINSVGDFVLFLGKVIVVACCVFVGYKLVENKEGLHYMAVPLTVIGVFAYFVAHAFMTAFEMIIDTIFICFCEDCDMNDGQQNPYFMSKGLMEFVEKSQKVLKVGDAQAEPRSQTSRWLPED